MVGIKLRLTAPWIALIFFAACCLTPMQLGAKLPLAEVRECLMSMSAVPLPLRFQDYPAVVQANLPPKAPVLDTSDAVEFRSALRQAAKQRPNFAGHYTIAVWGCGSSCSDFAVIDARSGKVIFDQNLRFIYAGYVNDEPGPEQPEFNALRFRPDSRLLVILGMPREDEMRDGVAFYEWTGSGLKQLRFVPRAKVCKVYP